MKNAWLKFREYLGFLIILTVMVAGILFMIPAFLLLALGAWVSPKGAVDINQSFDKATATLKAWGEKHGQTL